MFFRHKLEANKITRNHLFSCKFMRQAINHGHKVRALYFGALGFHLPKQDLLEMRVSPNGRNNSAIKGRLKTIQQELYFLCAESDECSRQEIKSCIFLQIAYNFRVTNLRWNHRKLNHYFIIESGAGHER